MTGRILYRISSLNESIVFADPARAMLVDRMNRALQSTTWGEFLNAMSEREAQAILENFDDGDEPRPQPDEAFDPEQVPGFSEGELIPWLQQEMDSLLPRAFLETFGTRETGIISGSWWSIPASRLADALAELVRLGYVVDDASDLEFH